ncbi:MAG: hypothetical protein AXW14_00210 [Alteromonas sp. Nap_26]|nr:MAG: hypothetical protein AXW14_00210 [Alteromonas sp. Nap_26]
MHRLSVNATFYAASVAIILVYMTSGAPISLFNTYRLEDGITNADLGIVSLGYFLAAAVALLMFGQMSNYVGRKTMAIAALLCVLLSSILLLNMHSVWVLCLARILQGFACGVATSSIGAFVVDNNKGQPKWLVATITSTSPMIGISLGAMSTGALVSWGPFPRTLAFALLVLITTLCLAFMLFAKETVSKKVGALRSLYPNLYFTTGQGFAMLSMTGVVVATWSLGAFYQAFGPSVLAEQIGTTNAFISAMAFSSVMILTPVGGFVSHFFSPKNAVRLGMFVYLCAAWIILFALSQGYLVLFLVASLCVGLAQGIATTACLHILLNDVAIEIRARLLSTIFVISYSGAVVPITFASLFASSYSVFEICIGYITLGTIAALVGIIASSQLRTPDDAIAKPSTAPLAE